MEVFPDYKRPDLLLGGEYSDEDRKSDISPMKYRESLIEDCTISPQIKKVSTPSHH